MHEPLNPEQCRQILGISPEAGAGEIRQAYRDLVQVWHPDRFQEERLKTLAERRLREINRAYELLHSAPDREAACVPEPQPSEFKQPVRPWRISPPWSPVAVAGFLATLLVLAGGTWSALALLKSSARHPVAIPSVSRVGSSSPAPPFAADRTLTPQRENRNNPRVRRDVATEQPVRPETGELTPSTAPKGSGRILISNNTADDAYIQVIGKTKQVVRTVYIRAGDSAAISDLPMGWFMVEAELGKDWLAGARAFGANRHRMMPAGPLEILNIQGSGPVQSDTYRITLGPLS